MDRILERADESTQAQAIDAMTNHNDKLERMKTECPSILSWMLSLKTAGLQPRLNGWVSLATGDRWPGGSNVRRTLRHE